MTADDYFTLNRYEGEIYKTNNLQGRVLANYCKTDSALVKEQNRIEKELTDLELSVWGKIETPKDSLETVNEGKEKAKKKVSSEKSSGTRNSRRNKTEKVKSASTKTSNTQAAPRVSVRRQRR